MQAVSETAGIRNKSGNRCTERNTGLLDRGDGRGSDVLLAMFRASHDVLKDESPADANTNADQGDWQEQSSNRPGHHHYGNPQ